MENLWVGDKVKIPEEGWATGVVTETPTAPYWKFTVRRDSGSFWCFNRDQLVYDLSNLNRAK